MRTQKARKQERTERTSRNKRRQDAKTQTGRHKDANGWRCEDRNAQAPAPSSFQGFRLLGFKTSCYKSSKRRSKGFQVSGLTSRIVIPKQHQGFRKQDALDAEAMLCLPCASSVSPICYAGSQYTTDRIFGGCKKNNVENATVSGFWRQQKSTKAPRVKQSMPLNFALLRVLPHVVLAISKAHEEARGILPELAHLLERNAESRAAYALSN